MKPTKLKLTADILLNLATKQLKTNPKKFYNHIETKLGLQSATYLRTDRKTFKKINPKTNEPLYRDEHIYETRNYFIKTTQYGNILDIEEKPRSIIKPKVTVKKKRTYSKPQK